jgi:hypothetical protein
VAAVAVYWISHTTRVEGAVNGQVDPVTLVGTMSTVTVGTCAGGELSVYTIDFYQHQQNQTLIFSSTQHFIAA